MPDGSNLILSRRRWRRRDHDLLLLQVVQAIGGLYAMASALTEQETQSNEGGGAGGADAMTPMEFVQRWGPDGDDPTFCQVRYMMLADLAEREQQIREECAKIAESSTDGVHRVLCTHIAAAIRARGAADTS